MGDDSGEVDMSEEAMDKFNDKRSEAMSAFSDGDFQVWPQHNCFILLTQLFGCSTTEWISKKKRLHEQEFLFRTVINISYKKFKFFWQNLAAGSL